MSLQEPGRLPNIKMLHPDVEDNHGGAWMMLYSKVLIKSDVEIKVRIVVINEKVV